MIRRVPLYLFVLAVYAFLFAPIVIVLVNSFNADEALTGWGGFTTHWYRVAAHDGTVLDGARTTLKIAALSTLVATVLGTLAAVGLRRAGRGMRGFTDTTTYARLVMPELVLAIGLLLLFRALNLQLGLATVVIGHVSLFTSYVIMIVGARLAGLDASTEEAARDLGATALRALVRVTVPELLPAIVASGLLIFTFSMDNVVSSLFLSSGMNTLPLVLFSMIRIHVTPEVNAIAAAFVGVTLCILAVFFVVSAGRAAFLVGRNRRS